MSLSNDRSSFLIYDLIASVVEFCRDDYALLFRCALVNWEFNRVASVMLYSRVVIAPQFKPILNLRDTNPIPDSSNFPSACLPQYAPYVLYLQVSGFVSARPPPRNTLSEMLAVALRSFVSLHTIRFTPTTYHEDLFTSSLPILCSTRTLTNLAVNQSCCDEARAPTLVQVNGLRSLTLLNPGRAILELLPAWIERLSSTLTEFHLKGNCGSVTPGVLKSLVPHIKDTLKGFTLGLSYSLMDQDTFSFLENFTQLEHVNFRYYWQLRSLPRGPQLANLRSFTATYHEVYATGMNDKDSFGRWVRRAISGSPRLEELHLVCEDAELRDHPLDLARYDGLVDSLIKKHHATLRVLDLGAAVVTLRKLKEVLSACVQLEELTVTVDRGILRTLFSGRRLVPKLQHLRSLSFHLSNEPHKSNIEGYAGLLSTLMQSLRFPALRRVTINGSSWEGFYTLNPDSRLQFVVQRAEDIILPWYRKKED
ncbi:hypothetical protein BDN70DRAFT_994118 [Pholiota conissans]|uniref:F-box domain-containing protein n=1 Tax=Pholiota conissans TaxID=109636 RepID=A0A9P6D0F1_9AGAR|nr:hypothetical protein BDN70DRAFT_994118 [Pholiota conissans]